MSREIGDIENDLEYEKDYADDLRQQASEHDETVAELELELEEARENDHE